MVTYKCFKCGKSITDKNLEKRFVCPSCGSKIFYKPNQVASVWCFFASLAPIYNYFVFNYMKNKNLQ